MSDSTKFVSGDDGDNVKGGGGFSVHTVSEPSIPHDGGRSLSGITKLALGSSDSLIDNLIVQDNTIPLSPQWLIAKSGDNKPPPLSMDPPRTPGSHGGTSDLAVKERWRVDGSRDVEKRRDWWRTTTESDSNRRDGWREEERESVTAIRRDRWKESGDGGNDSRRVERWPDNSSSARDPVDGRRANPSDRWSDSSNRDVTSENLRRTSKWSTRWGPEDKDKEIRREKRSENEKETDGGNHTATNRDRTNPNLNSNRSDTDREADASARDRVWRPHSLASRSKGEGSLLGSTPPKYAPGFGVGRGRGENSSVGFAIGRGRAITSVPRTVGSGSRSVIGASASADKSDINQAYRYPRAKLLDVYRNSYTISSFLKYPENFLEAPEVTESEPVEPLAFIAPEAEERDVLERISKGNVVGSGAVYTSKEKNQDHARVERDDVLMEISKEEDKMLDEVEDTVAFKHVISDNMVMPIGNVISEDRADAVQDNQLPIVSRGEESSPVSLNEKTNNQQLTDSLRLSNREIEVSHKYIAKETSRPAKMEHEEKKEIVEAQYVSTPPEELSLYYVDPQGAVQGPFLGSDIIGWFELGYFDTGLPVRVADVPEDIPFTPLGDIMPQLKTKSEVPWEYQAADRHSEKDAVIVERNSTQILAIDSNKQHEFQDQALLNGSMESTNNLILPGTQLHDTGRDITVEKALELQPPNPEMDMHNSLLERTSSARRRMSAFPDIEAETGEFSRQSLFSQRWPAGTDMLPSSSQAVNGYASPRLPTPQSAFWQSGTHESHEPLPMEGSSFLHGLDDLKMRQLLQLEKLQARQQLDHSGAPSPHSAQQQQKHSLLDLLNQPKASLTPPFDQIRNPDFSLDFNPNALQQLASGHPLQQIPAPHPLQQLASSHSLSRLQHPSNYPIPPSDAKIEELLRLQQQHQTPHPLLDQLLRHHMQFPSAEQIHMPNRVNHHLHDNSSFDMHAYQLEQLHQRHQQDAFLELLLQRQQEEKLHAQQQVHLLQQQQLKLDEQRVSGVWEVDEFGQFVRTQASIPMQSTHETLQQQQLHLMQQKANFHPVRHPRQQHLQVDHPGMYSGDLSQMQQSKLDIRTLRELQAETEIAALLSGTSRIDMIPADPLTYLQAQRSRFEGQTALTNPAMMPYEMDMMQKNQLFHASTVEATERAFGGQTPLPSHAMMPYEIDMSHKNQAFHGSTMEASEAGRICGSIPHDAELDSMQMFAMSGRETPRSNLNFRQQLSLNPEIASMNDHIMDINPENLLHANDGLVNVLRKQQQQQQQQQHVRAVAQPTTEDLMRLIAGSAPSEEGSALNSMFSCKDRQFNPNLPVNQQLDSLGYIMNQSTQSARNGSLLANAQQDEAEQQKGESPVLVSISAKVEAPDPWTSAAHGVEEDSLQVSSFDQTSIDVCHAEGSVNNISSSVNKNVTEPPKSVHVSGKSPDVSVIVNDDNEFVETKDAKKNKKRGMKGKPGKVVSVSLLDSDAPLSSPGKSTPGFFVTDDNTSVTLSSPSLGDFLPIKEDKVAPQPSPVWSVDPSKHIKVATSLKEIQEAEKKARDEHERQHRSTGPQTQVPLQKPSNPIPISNSASAWQRPLLSSQHTAPKSQLSPANSNNFKSKIGVIENDEELFWDYNDSGNSKQSLEQNTMAKKISGLSSKGNESVPRQAAVGSPSLSGFSAAVAKPPPVKVVNKQLEVPATVSQQATLSIGEAKAFRRWCEEQIKKFSGKGHMSLLEFCIHLPSASEAGDYLSAYLGDGPLEQAFKAEFLRRKETIPPEIARVVFPSSEAVVKDGFQSIDNDRRTDNLNKKTAEDEESEFEIVRSGKRKGKKGKKVVDPSLVLGFNVSSSNRIFMGEIQHIND